MKHFQFVLIPNRVNLVSVRSRRRGRLGKSMMRNISRNEKRNICRKRRRNICPSQKRSHSGGLIKAERKSAGEIIFCPKSIKLQDQVLTFTAKTMRITSQSDPLCNSVSLPPEKLRPPFFFAKCPVLVFPAPPCWANVGPLY